MRGAWVMSPSRSPGRTPTRLFSAGSVALVIALAHGVAHGQPDDARTLARDLFQRGVHAAARGDYASAVEHFEAALHLRSAPSIVYNLASAQFELGRLPEAFDTLSTLDRAAAADDVRTRANELEASLRAKLALLSVHSSDPHLTLRIDGVARPPPRVTEQLPLTPGSHVVEVLHGTRPVLVRTVELVRGGQLELDVVPDALPEPTPTATPAEPAPLLVPAHIDASTDTERERAARRRRIIGLSLAAGVIVAVGVAVPLTLRAHQQRSDEPPPTTGLSPGVLSW